MDARENIILDGHKLDWHRERVQAWLAGERIVPITIDLATTRSCNFRCCYCYGKLQSNDQKRMTRDVIYRFLDDATELGVKGVSFISDGESTCSPHFYDTVRRGRDNGLDIGMATNGSLLRPDKMEQLLRDLTYLRFNISGATETRYCMIMGTKPKYYRRVLGNIRLAVEIKKALKLPVTIGLQMVLMADFADQLLPLARLGRELGVDYLVIKHCSDDELHSLGVKYESYRRLAPLLTAAEALSAPGYQVRVKWSKILSEGQRQYDACYGPQFLMQFSGSGLVAPCGMLFNRRYRHKYHIGNIAETSFKTLWKSDRYWEVMDRLANPQNFDPHSMCGYMCIQHLPNQYLWEVKQGTRRLESPPGPPPLHINFV